MSDEYGYTKEDAEQKGGSTAKKRGKYTGSISRATTKKDKNGKVYLGFGLSHTFAPYKNGLSFENYLPLSRDSNAYQLARRNSFLGAIGIKEGQTPPGAPGGPDAKALDGTFVDFNIEHEFEDVPGEDYSLVTGKSAKSAWVTGGWEAKLDSKGNLVVDGKIIQPKEVVTFYAVSDEFIGLGAEDGAGADEEPWG